MSATVASIDWYNEDSVPPMTVNQPVGSAVGDLLVAIIAQHAPSGNIGDMSTPSGWTLQSSGADPGVDAHGKVFTHVVTGGDPSTWDFPYNNSADTCLGMFRVTGADVASPVITTALNSLASIASSDDSPSVTPFGPDDLLIVALANFANGTLALSTVPSGTTTDSSTQVSSLYMSLAAAHKQLTSGTATGAQTWTSVSPTGNPGQGISVVIKSAGSTQAQIGSTPQALPPHLLYMIIAELRNNGESPTSTNPDQTATPGGITTSEVFGLATLSATATVSANGIVSAEVFGNPSNTLTVTAQGIVTGEAFGNTLTAPVASAQGIKSAEALGQPTVTSTVTITAQGITSSETFGNTTVITASSLQAQGIPSSEQLGSPSITSTVTINAQGIPSSEALGNGTTTLNVQAQGIPTAQAVGSPTMTFSFGAVANGIPSSETFGSVSVTSTVTVTTQGITSSERVGSPSVTATSVVQAGSITSGETFGRPTLTPGSVTVTAQGITSGEALGGIQVSLGILAQQVTGGGIASDQAVGQSFIGPFVTVDVSWRTDITTITWVADPPVYYHSDVTE